MNNWHQIQVLARYFRRWYHTTLNQVIFENLDKFNQVAEKYRRKHPGAWGA